MVEKTPLLKRTFSGFLWMISGKATIAGLQFIVTIVLARLLIPSDFGIVSAAAIVMAFISIFSMVGIGPALVQRHTLNSSHIRTGFTLSIVLSVFFGLLLFYSAPLISNFFNMNELILVLQAMSVIYFINGFATVAESLIQRKMKFRLFATIEVISYTVYGIIGITGALIGLGYWSLVVGQISQSIVETTLLITLGKHLMKPQFHWKSVKELIFFGTGYTIAELSNSLALQADNLVVGRWLGSNALGLYGRAYQLMVMPSILFGQVMDKVLFPAMSRIQHRKDQLTWIFRVGITGIALLTIPVGVLISMLAKDIVLLLFGRDWLNLVPALQVLALGLVFRTGYKMSDTLAKATGAVYRRSWRQMIYAIAVFVGAWIGQHWGIVGVAYGVMGAIILNYGMMTSLSLRFINFAVWDIIKAHIPGMILGGVAVGSVLSIRVISLMIPLLPIFKIALSGFLFFIITFLFLNSRVRTVLGEDVMLIREQMLNKIVTKKVKKAQ